MKLARRRSYGSSIRHALCDRSRSALASRGQIAVVFLRLQTVIRVTGLSRSTLYRLIADEQFPRPVQLGPRAVAWRRTDIEAWGEARPTSTH
jgi:prophage regulatory protein